MKRLALCLLAVACVSCLANQNVRAEDNVPPEGFTALFNGKDLTGWKGLIEPPKKAKLKEAGELEEAQKKADESMKEHWSVEDGVLVFDGKGQNLCTVEDYGDFELHVDWKIHTGGDSGIYLRGNPQVQIWDPDFPKYKPLGADKGSGALWNNAKHERFPLERADNPVEQWNRFRIIMVGDKLTVYLNDKLVVKDTVMENFWEKGKPLPETGSIELQNHGNKLYFKNVFVKKLK